MPSNPKLSSEVHPGKKKLSFSSLSASDTLSPEVRSSFRWSPSGPLWISFHFIFRFFFLLRKKGFIPRRGSYWNAPLWGPIWVSFSFISNPKKSFLTFNLHEVSAHFWYWRMEGTIDGGRVGPFFFFAHILKTIWYFFLIVSGSLKRWFSTYFGIFSEKKTKCYFFQKKSPKSNIPFSRKVLHVFLKFLKNYSIFFPDCFCFP